MFDTCIYSGLPYTCNFCPDNEENEAPCNWCSKQNKYCVHKCECNPELMKIMKCYDKLKKQSLFENL